MWPTLIERQRRALLGAVTREVGWGAAAVAKVAGAARSTVSLGVAELGRAVVVSGRSCRSDFTRPLGLDRLAPAFRGG